MKVPLIPTGDEFVRQAQALRRLLNLTWEPHILALLSRKTMPHAELRDSVREMDKAGGAPSLQGVEISDQALHETLEVMIDSGLVSSHREQVNPSSETHYALTLTGLELTFSLRPVLHWVARHNEVIEQLTMPETGPPMREAET